MSTKLLLVAAIAATSFLFLDATDAHAQGRRFLNRGYGSYRQPSNYYSLPSSRIYSNSNRMYSARSFAPYSANYGSFRGYGFGSGYGYGSGYGNYGYPSRSGLSIGIGVGGFGNGGFGGYRGFGY